jgi:upstream activation factor subunit UAF30
MPATKKSTAKKAPVKKTTSKKPVPIETPVEVPVETPVEVSTETPVETPEVFMDYSQSLLDMKQKVKDTMVMCKDVLQMISDFERTLNKDVKVARKLHSKKVAKSKSASNSNSGFTKLGHVSTEMCKFLGVPDDHQLARVDVTREITDYCKKHNLQKEEDKRVLLPDKKLSNLLKLDKDVTLTFFNLQKYLKNHFKPEPGQSAF